MKKSETSERIAGSTKAQKIPSPAPKRIWDAAKKVMLGIAQGLLGLLRTKPPRKQQSVARNSW